MKQGHYKTLAVQVWQKDGLEALEDNQGNAVKILVDGRKANVTNCDCPSLESKCTKRLETPAESRLAQTKLHGSSNRTIKFVTDNNTSRHWETVANDLDRGSVSMTLWTTIKFGDWSQNGKELNQKKGERNLSEIAMKKMLVWNAGQI